MATEQLFKQPGRLRQLPLSQQARRPEFFVVGAPRCGTTALYRWLREHPSVFMPDIKESHYFASDLDQHRKVHTEQEYLDLFRAATRSHRVIGEASVMYLCSEVAIDNLLAFDVNSKLIVTLRNPLTMLPSWHGQLLSTGQEEVADFASAWQLQEERRQGASIPVHCTVGKALQYAEVGRLGAQVDRLLKKCDRKQVHFVIYDDLKKDPLATYHSLLTAIGVGYDGRTSFAKVNVNRAIPSPLASRLWQQSQVLREGLNVARQVIGKKIYDRARDVILPYISRPVGRAPLAASMREELIAEYSEDVLLLSNLIGRDLSHWLKGEGKSGFHLG